MIVAFAVASEYCLFNIQESQAVDVGTLSGGSLSFMMSTPLKTLKIISHITAVLGTLIWGFGDWLLVWWLKS